MRATAWIPVLVAVLVSPATQTAAPQERQGIAPADSVEPYRAFLRKLPVAKKESILVARDELLKYLSGSDRCGEDVSCAQKVFEAFCKFYVRIIAAGNAPLEENRAAQDLLMVLGGGGLERPLTRIEGDRATALRKASAETRPTLRQLFAYRDCGLDFTQGEGIWYLRPDPDWIIALAAHLPAGEYRDYIIFDAHESRERLEEDGGFQVPRDTLRLKLVRWDTFIRTHPNVARTEKLRVSADRIAGWYIVGLPNTQAFESSSPSEPRVLVPELRESFARFLAANQDCSYYPLISGLWKQVKASNFRPTEAVVAYLEKQTASSPELRRWVADLRGPR